MRCALVLGRFHAVTRAQAQWLESLSGAPVERLVCVLTSANHSGTRRNPLDAATREVMLRPALARAGKPFELVRVDDIPNSEEWVAHVVAEVKRAVGVDLTSADTTVYSANRDVQALFRGRGFTVVSDEAKGLTPHELVQRVVAGEEWEAEASAETVKVYSRPAVRARLQALFSQTLLTEDGELGHARDFKSYGAQMDASLRQKLEDLVPWVKPGCVVDKGCGTGKLLVELARLFPESKLVGVDLSREFLRLCDENTYASDDVELVFGNIIERNVAPGSATTVIYSSVMHEVHSYTSYDVKQIDRALSNAFAELVLGGHVLVREGVSPPPATWRLELLTEASRDTFQRFAKEFKKGQGVSFVRLDERTVRLSSHDANEFLCKKDYLKNWHIEVHEEFGPLTLEGWREALTRAGFEQVHLTEYVNAWIAANRYQGTVAVFDEAGKPLPWPATNCVVVGRKSVPGAAEVNPEIGP
ncbi:MAG: methyltransferase domain-containing protein [Myxococcales bacterium]|nr:methyltransferase domain-containing protein [Myxococcales bacterium]